MLRLLIHIFLASVLAPVLGVAAYLVLDWWSKGELGDASVSRTLLFAGFGGLYALVFISFFTLPFGVPSSFVCYRMAKAASATFPVWLGICTLLGLLFGIFMGFWGSISVMTCALIGAVIGAVLSFVLRKVWTYDWTRVA